MTKRRKMRLSLVLALAVLLTSSIASASPASAVTINRDDFLIGAFFGPT